MAFNYWQEFEEHQFYHVYNKASKGLVLFQDEQDYKIFIEKLLKYIFPILKIYGYCLIPNHFHLLISVRDLETISEFSKTQNSKAARLFFENNELLNEFIIDQFRRFFSSIAIKFKNKYRHEGSVFLERFKRIKSVDEYKNIHWLAYIHHNPIHHGLVNDYKNWKYSSYNAFGSSGKSLLETNEAIAWFGGKSFFDDYHRDFKYIPDDFEK